LIDDRLLALLGRQTTAAGYSRSAWVRRPCRVQSSGA